MGQYFADKSASKESQFFDLQHDIEDTQETKELLLSINSNGADYDSLIELQKALSFQLRYREAIKVLNSAIDLSPLDFEAYRFRAARCLNTLQFDLALSDFKTCDLIRPQSLDIVYRLGITEFLRSNFEVSIEHLKNALALADSGDMQIAALYWHTLACYRLGNLDSAEKCLNEYLRKDMDVGHHTAYFKAMQVCAGFEEADSMVEELYKETDDLEYVTALYGICVWLEANEKQDRAAILKQKLIKKDGFWPCFAYLAAYNDCAL